MIYKFMERVNLLANSLKLSLSDPSLNVNDREKYLNSFWGKFSYENFLAAERKPTYTELEIVTNIQATISPFLINFGCKNPILPEIKFIDVSKFTPQQRQSLRFVLGEAMAFNFPSSNIVFIVGENYSKLKLAYTLGHETSHQNKIHNITPPEESSFLNNILALQKPALDEQIPSMNADIFECTICEKLSILFGREQFSLFPLLQPELALRDKLLSCIPEEKRGILKDSSVESERTSTGKYIFQLHNSFLEERLRLDQLIESIHQRKRSIFPEKEDVLQMFTDAHFNEKKRELVQFILSVSKDEPRIIKYPTQLNKAA